MYGTYVKYIYESHMDYNVYIHVLYIQDCLWLFKKLIYLKNGD